MTSGPISTNTTVGVSVTEIVNVDDYGSGNKDGRITYQILNNGNVTIYLGDENVTTNSGMPLPAGATMGINLRLGGKVYAISTSSSQDIRIMKVS